MTDSDLPVCSPGPGDVPGSESFPAGAGADAAGPFTPLRRRRPGASESAQCRPAGPETRAPPGGGAPVEHVPPAEHTCAPCTRTTRIQPGRPSGCPDAGEGGPGNPDSAVGRGPAPTRSLAPRPAGPVAAPRVCVRRAIDGRFLRPPGRRRPPCRPLHRPPLKNRQSAIRSAAACSMSGKSILTRTHPSPPHPPPSRGRPPAVPRRRRVRRRQPRARAPASRAASSGPAAPPARARPVAALPHSLFLCPLTPFLIPLSAHLSYIYLSVI